jgi:hypothetical protein
MWKHQLSANRPVKGQPILNFLRFTRAILTATFMFLYFFTVSVTMFVIFMIALEVGFTTIKSIGK